MCTCVRRPTEGAPRRGRHDGRARGAARPPERGQPIAGHAEHLPALGRVGRRRVELGPVKMALDVDVQRAARCPAPVAATATHSRSPTIASACGSLPGEPPGHDGPLRVDARHRLRAPVRHPHAAGVRRQRDRLVGGADRDGLRHGASARCCLSTRTPQPPIATQTASPPTATSRRSPRRRRRSAARRWRIELPQPSSPTAQTPLVPQASAVGVGCRSGCRAGRGCPDPAAAPRRRPRRRSRRRRRRCTRRTSHRPDGVDDLVGRGRDQREGAVLAVGRPDALAVGGQGARTVSDGDRLPHGVGRGIDP